MTNKERTIIYTAYISLIVCVVSLLFMNINKSRVLSTVMKDYERFSILSSVWDNRILELSSIGFDISGVALRDVDGNIVDLSEVIESKEITVFRFSTNQCNTCYESQLEIIGDLMHTTQSDMIFIVSVDTNIMQVELMRKQHSIDAKVYGLCDEYLSMPVDSAGKPYYFRLSSDCKPKDLFVPDKNFPELTIQYINRI